MHKQDAPSDENHYASRYAIGISIDLAQGHTRTTCGARNGTATPTVKISTHWLEHVQKGSKREGAGEPFTQGEHVD